MPLRIVPPRQGKSSNYSIRGTYLGVSVDRTAKTPDRATARKVLNQIKADIERGGFAERQDGISFAAGALAYIRAGGEATYIGPLNDHFGDTPLNDIGQAEVDEAAALLYPNATAATRNRQVYTPVSAIMKHNGVETRIRRPKGAQGEVRVTWLWPEQFAVLADAAEGIDKEFGIFLTLLAYCGPRLSEALDITCDDLRMGEAFAFVRSTKNGDPRPMFMPPVVVAALANHPRGLDRPGETVFRFRKNGRLYTLMRRAKTASGLSVPVSFHVLRHTWATWMRRYAGLDIKGLMDTKAWRNMKSAARYAHVTVSEEARKATLLPVAGKKGKP